jgi:hypothetical protein
MPIMTMIRENHTELDSFVCKLTIFEKVTQTHNRILRVLPVWIEFRAQIKHMLYWHGKTESGIRI